MSTKSTTKLPDPTPDEKALTALNVQLANRQLAQLDQLAPFQKQLLEQATTELGRSTRLNAALDAAVTPEQQAAAYKDEYERSQRLGPIQDELLQLQLEQLRQGGKATPEQLQLIQEATDASIAAGSADIDASTGRGIGLIADELANARGLRLSDSPISSEAALLAREGEIQKGSLTKNLRANQATAALNYPLAVNGVQSGINQSQQGINTAATQFQAQLRQQAYQNRLSLTGQAQGGGIGLANITPNPVQFRNQGGTSTNKGMGIGEIGQLAGGLGAAYLGYAAFAASDRRLKHDHGVVGETKGGLKLHLYKYKSDDASDPLRLGVMAQEVEKIIPDAVHTHKSGFKVVDYAKVR